LEKNSEISNHIIKKCPFCTDESVNNINIGNLEHLHLYCSSRFLQKAREHCLQKIESAIYELYEFAAYKEYNCSLANLRRNTTLQENFMRAAKVSELLERPIIRASHLVNEKRVENIAIKSRHEIHWLVVMRKLRQEKLDEYDRYPLSSQLGFLHAIPEEDFNVSTVTIIDVSFLELFTKKIFQTLRNYELENKRLNDTGSKNF